MACFPLCRHKMDSIRLWQALPIDITRLMLENIFIWIGLIFQAPTFRFFSCKAWTDFSKPFLSNHAAQKQKLNWKVNTPCTSPTLKSSSMTSYTWKNTRWECTNMPKHFMDWWARMLPDDHWCELSSLQVGVQNTFQRQSGAQVYVTKCNR